MLSCPNCGGNLKFDIPSQQLSCEHCHTLFDPYDFDGKTSDAEESKTFDGDYEVTIFTCPQCGGEILSTDNAAAGFCSFCGASTILYSRISHEKRPNYIIPFQKTKEQCKEAYARRMKHSIFAPKELRDPSYIDSFRGIYMPYWAFYISQKGSLSLNGKRLPAAVIILLPITTHLPGIWMPTTKVFPMMPHPLLMTISVKNWLLII
ncbi:MAG: hypothetical protein ACLROW_10440 [Roseburia faecis]